MTKFSRPQPLQVTAPGQQVGQWQGGKHVAGDGAVVDSARWSRDPQPNSGACKITALCHRI